MLKLKIKELCITYSISRGKSKKHKHIPLQKELDSLICKMEKDPRDKALWQQKLQCEHQINEMYEAEAKGYQIRSKAKWINKGEQSTAYFFKLEQKHQ